MNANKREPVEEEKPRVLASDAHYAVGAFSTGAIGVHSRLFAVNPPVAAELLGHFMA
jgi:hypothetical protein